MIFSVKSFLFENLISLSLLWLWGLILSIVSFSILSFKVREEPLISGTIKGMFFCILHAEELSITVVPFSANVVAHSLDKSPPAEKIAMEGFLERADSIDSIV